MKFNFSPLTNSKPIFIINKTMMHFDLLSVSYHFNSVVFGVEEKLVFAHDGSIGVIPVNHECKPVVGLQTKIKGKSCPALKTPMLC